MQSLSEWTLNWFPLTIHALSEVPPIGLQQGSSVSDLSDPQHSEISKSFLWKDRSFVGMLITQFLGAFNDNLFKQIVMLVCLDQVLQAQALNQKVFDLQGVATALFAIPFILLSGYCGYLADRKSKRSLVVFSKVLEIVVMCLGLVAFRMGNITAMLAVLFCMGGQSALFGPPKYGILPELFREQDLPRINGIFLMTTFIAIIGGIALAGELKQTYDEQLWIISSTCIVIAIIGTLSSLLIRKTPVANPNVKFHLSSLVVSPDARQTLLSDRKLLMAITATSIFWMTGGVFPAAVNGLGKLQFGLNDAITARLTACTAIGIAIGCPISGLLSRNRFDAKLVRFGLLGMLGGLIALALPGGAANSFLGVQGSAIVLVWIGMCAGIFNVPLQAYLQARTPANQKGQMIGAMNLANWIGIALAGVYYQLWSMIFERFELPANMMFAATALILVPVVLFYHPVSEAFGKIKDPMAVEIL